MSLTSLNYAVSFSQIMATLKCSGLDPPKGCLGDRLLVDSSHASDKVKLLG